MSAIYLLVVYLRPLAIIRLYKAEWTDDNDQ
jgi:hypothetical protein